MREIKKGEDTKDTPEAAPKKGKGKLIVIILVVLILIVVGIGGFLFLENKKAAEDEASPDGEEVPAKVVKKDKKNDSHAAPIFVNLDTMVSNLTPSEGVVEDRYVQVQLTLEVENQEADGKIKNHIAKVKHHLLLILGSKNATTLNTREGKDKLAEEIKDKINDIINPPTKNKKGETIRSEEVVKQTLFTSILVQ